MCTLRPIFQPDMASPCRNAPIRACHSGSSALLGRTHRSVASGQAAEHPPRAATPPRRQNCDELAPFHSITSRSRASTVGGMVMPRARAVLRLSISSNFVGACTREISRLFPFEDAINITGCARNCVLSVERGIRIPEPAPGCCPAPCRAADGTRPHLGSGEASVRRGGRLALVASAFGPRRAHTLLGRHGVASVRDGRIRPRHRRRRDPGGVGDVSERRPVGPDQHDRYAEYEAWATYVLLEHCKRAIARAR